MSGHEYGLEYHSNRNAWMTSFPFHDWLKHFDQYINFFNKKALLLANSFRAHGLHETAPKLKSVELYFSPPNNTSKIQLCGDGIIATLNVRYPRFQMDECWISLRTRILRISTKWTCSRPYWLGNVYGTQ